MAVVINGRDLTVEEVIRALAAEIEKDKKLPLRHRKQYRKQEIILKKNWKKAAVIYGLTTGILVNLLMCCISKEETADLQRNLIISHTCALGEPYPRQYVRAAMLLRCNALSRGNSGIRLSTVQTMVDMLNAGVHPVIPRKGSLGASGDLAPLSHIALGLIGLGKVEYKGETVDAARL